jgi:hypothetical protein
VILYLIYSASLLCIGEGILEHHDKILGFVDNTAMIVVGSSIQDNLRKLEKLGVEGLEWAKHSTSQFDLGKYQLVHHPRRTTPIADTLLPLRIGNETINPSESAKYLGVFIDSKLNFKTHIEYATAKGARATFALSRLSNPTSGMPHKYIRRLFIGLVVPRMEYVLGVWYNPVRDGNGSHRIGSVGTATTIGKSQRLACRIAVGGLCSTSTIALNLHANLLPVIH